MVSDAESSVQPTDRAEEYPVHPYQPLTNYVSKTDPIFGYVMSMINECAGIIMEIRRAEVARDPERIQTPFDEHLPHIVYTFILRKFKQPDINHKTSIVQLGMFRDELMKKGPHSKLYREFWAGVPITKYYRHSN